MRKNTLSKRNYVLETVFWAVIAFIWYNNLFFTNISGRTVLESNVILIAMIAFAVLANSVFTLRWRRNTASAVTSVLTPFGVYSYITYEKYMPKAYKVIVLVGIAVCAIAAFWIVLSRIQTKTKKRRIVTKAKMTYLTVRFVGAAVSVSFITCLFCRTYVGGALLSAGESATSTYGDEYTIAENMDTVLLLQEDEWKKLSLEERLDVLQCICNIEGNYLGLNRKIHIYASKLDEQVMGDYNDSASSIQISVELLESGDPYETLDTVCHEMFHAAQHRYVEIYKGLDDSSKNSYFLYNASVYAEEFQNYKSGRKSSDVSEFLDYYGQWCEHDARSYAQDAVVDYYKRIAEYLGQSEEAGNE